MKRYLLDTNAYSGLFLGNKEVFRLISSAERVYMSVFVQGELHAGFQGGSRVKANMRMLSEFLCKSTVESLPAGEETAEIFGELKTILKKAGTPLPINDIWIAAHTIETGSQLITYDAHFRKIPGLRLAL